MKKILVVLVGLLMIGLLTTSCKKEEWEKVSDSTYPQLNGEYIFYEYWSDANGINEDYFYDSYDFNSTNQCETYSLIWSYSTTSGWSNALKESHTFTETWKIEGGFFKTHLYDNEFAKWYSNDFKFIDANHIELGGLIYTKGGAKATINLKEPNGKPKLLNQTKINNINKRIEYLRSR